MNFELTDRCNDYMERLLAFMDERIYPAEAVYEAQMHEACDPNFHPPILEELKDVARSRGLWNLFHPHPEWGPGLKNAEYTPLAEITGRSPHLAPEALNCSAPDTGNMAKTARCLIVMGKTDPDGPPHRQQSMLVVPIDAPGVTVVRGLPVFGYWDREGHAEACSRMCESRRARCWPARATGS